MQLIKKITFALCLTLFAGLTLQAQPILTVSENGVGPINKDTPYDLKKIQSLLPALKVKKGQGGSEGEVWEVLNVSDKTHLLFSIKSNDHGKIDYIWIKSNRLQTASGIKIGSLFPQIYQNSRPKSCEVMLEEMTGRIQCDAPNSKHLKYIFAGRGFPEGDSGVPPLKILRRGKVESILWAK